MSKSPSNPSRTGSSASVDDEIAGLETLDAATLRAQWPTWFGRPPPARMQRRMLALALAHRIQSQRLGGLSRNAARFLDDVAARVFDKHGAAPVKARRIKAGAKLVREWRGVAHEVTVVDGGFVWNGALYRSLSAIARAITGTRWNGLVFFGLKTGPGTAERRLARTPAIDPRSAP